MKKRGKRWKLTAEILLTATVCLAGIWQNTKETAESVNQVEKKEDDQEDKKIAITFDDGPDAVFTPVLLDGLKQRNVKASFFVIGQEAEKYPELIQRMKEEGHLIGNHTYHHVELTRVDAQTEQKEIEMTNEVLEQITGERPVFLRPPYGSWREEILQDMEMLPVKWNIDPLDWCTKSTGEIVRKVVTQAEENGIILLHDCYGPSVEAGLQIIDTLTEAGYRFVTVDELIMD
nr:polysaccharide deacetylase family protein [uncultured Sellimonas sp.]